MSKQKNEAEESCGEGEEGRAIGSQQKEEQTETEGAPPSSAGVAVSSQSCPSPSHLPEAMAGCSGLHPW